MRGSYTVFKVMSETLGPFTVQEGNVQILMYHCVQDHPTGIHYVPSALFRKQLEYLLENSYQFLTVRDVYRQWPDILDGPKTVVLTFDDLWASHVDCCLPIMKEYGVVGTFFVPTGLIQKHRYEADTWALNINADLGCWQDAEQLAANGMEIGCHTHTHQKMSTLSLQAVEEEMEKSTRILRERFSQDIETFCFPYGKPETYTQRDVRLLSEYGYKAACTTRWGRLNSATKLLELPRIEIHGLDDMQHFQNKIKGHYDFLRWKRR